MISYKDRCFCGFYDRCKQGQHCSRAMTEELIEEAEEFGLPIACYASEPECYEVDNEI